MVAIEDPAETRHRARLGWGSIVIYTGAERGDVLAEVEGNNPGQLAGKSVELSTSEEGTTVITVGGVQAASGWEIRLISRTSLGGCEATDSTDPITL